jgi:hypothetical protein
VIVLNPIFPDVFIWIFFFFLVCGTRIYTSVITSTMQALNVILGPRTLNPVQNQHTYSHVRPMGLLAVRYSNDLLTNT